MLRIIIRTNSGELETFIGKTKIWLWTAVNKHTQVLSPRFLGDEANKIQITGKSGCWNFYFYVQMASLSILLTYI